MLRALVLSALLVPGCAYGLTPAYRVASVSTSAGDTVVTEESAQRVSTGGGAPSFWFEDDSGGATTISTGTGSAAPSTSFDARRLEAVRDAEEADADFARHRELYAQAQTSTTPPEATATDAVDTSGELLIYTALFHVGVYDVEASQAAIAQSARSMGGIVFSQTDDTIVVRVPAARFMSFVGQIDGGYDVLHRQIDAQDVGEEFRDVEIRIRNLEAMRDRVAALLASAANVDEALAVEQQLERITGELESLRGRQRFLADRISLSTITVMFRPQPHDTVDQPEVFQLPFAWLESLGLPNLMELR